MPTVTITTYPGRSTEQRREVANAITEAMVKHFDCKPGNLSVIFQEVEPDSWAIGGVLGTDRKCGEPVKTEE